MHVLAVSGLHTGIVFLIISFLFGFVKRKRYGTFAFVLLVIIMLWGFALITGLSPSVTRSAAMFSFLIIGQNLRRQTNTYNMLAASAFFLLLTKSEYSF
jgi:competence protein ComEC